MATAGDVRYRFVTGVFRLVECRILFHPVRCVCRSIDQIRLLGCEREGSDEEGAGLLTGSSGRLQRHVLNCRGVKKSVVQFLHHRMKGGMRNCAFQRRRTGVRPTH